MLEREEELRYEVDIKGREGRCEIRRDANSVPLAVMYYVEAVLTLRSTPASVTEKSRSFYLYQICNIVQCGGNVAGVQKPCNTYE